MNYGKFAAKQIENIRRVVGKATAVSALSGGVDSTVTTILGHRAIGKRLKVVFLDDGLMREGEPKAVKSSFRKIGIDVKVVNVQKKFFAALKGLTDPEEKRKAFRETFYRTFQKAVLDTGAPFLLQGTIAPDIIETKGGVKTQHNVLEQIGINTKKGYSFTAIEPLKTLYKPGVREVGKVLGLPESMHQRMPFPGPGLLCRCLGEATPERIAIVRKACRIAEEETLRFKPFQTFGVLLADRATGLTDDKKRAFGHIVALRCIHSRNAMTAKAVRLPWATLERVRDRILREVPGVTKVVYDLTGKPPSTIEYI
jgi:GMP synthase (glutamine-hydrolysing)